MPVIFMETPRLILRQWQESDLEPFAALNQDVEVMEFFPSLNSKEQSKAQIERATSHITQYGYGFFALERKDNGRFIGFTGLANTRFDSYFTPCVEIGWRLSKSNWGQGFATEAAKACLDIGFNALQINEIYSFTSVLNLRSQQVMIKLGMTRNGIFNHPLIDDGHILNKHVLYKISKQQYYNIG